MNATVITRRVGAGLSLLAVMGSAALAARADLVIVSQVTVSGAANPELRAGRAPDTAVSDTPAPGANPTVYTLKTYYKGKLARYEMPDGTATIYDGAKGRVYTLDPQQKTYRVVAMKDALSLPAPILAQMPIKTNFDIQLTLTKTDATKTLAGKDAERYEIIGAAKPHFEAPAARQGGFGSGRRGGGGRRRGGGGGFLGGGFPVAPERSGFPVAQERGGYPNGGDRQGGRGGGNAARALPTLQLEGEYWLTRSDFLTADGKNTTLALIQPTVPSSPFLKAVADRLNKAKLIPLGSNLTLKTTMPGRDVTPVTIVTEVQSVTDAPAEASLFVVPAEYHMAN